jgi:hypothetical protein
LVDRRKAAGKWRTRSLLLKLAEPKTQDRQRCGRAQTPATFAFGPGSIA